MRRLPLLCLVACVVLAGGFLLFREVTAHSRQPGPQHQSDDVLQSYLDPARDNWQHTAEILDLMGLSSGMRIADVGAGSGYFTYHFSRRVGAQGKVYAVDTDPQAIAFLERRMGATPPEHPNVKTVKSRFDSVTLPARSLDWAFLCEAHFFLEPDAGSARCVRSILDALKPGGRLAVVEARDDPLRGKVDARRLSAPFEAAGFRRIAEHDILARELFMIFERPASKTSNTPRKAKSRLRGF